MTTVWFIRHGESEANIGLPTIDPAQVSLTSRGRRQAEQVARAFVRPPSIIVISSFLRAKETAEPLIKRYSPMSCIEPLVREFTYLSLSKQQKTTKQQRKPLVDAYWERLDPYYVDGDGTESFVQFMDRVSEVITCLKQGDDEDFIAVFSHEQFILATWWLLMNASRKIDSVYMHQFRLFLDEFTIPNGAIVEMRFSAKDEQEIIHISLHKGHLSL